MKQEFLRRQKLHRRFDMKISKEIILMIELTGDESKRFIEALGKVLETEKNLKIGTLQREHEEIFKTIYERLNTEDDE